MISSFIFEIFNPAPAAAWAADAGHGAPTAVPPPNSPPMNDIHDIKPLMDMGMDWQWLIWALAGLLAVAVLLLAWRWWRRRRAGTAEPAVAAAPLPEAEANALLDELAADMAISDKLFYFRLSAVLRRYVERRYGFPAAEMTVEELLPRVKRLSLPRELAESFDDLCRRSEPIKFAGMPAAGLQRKKDLDLVRSFVHQTTPMEAPEVNSPGETDKSANQAWAERIPVMQPHSATTGQAGSPTTEPSNNQLTE